MSLGTGRPAWPGQEEDVEHEPGTRVRLDRGGRGIEPVGEPGERGGVDRGGDRRQVVEQLAVTDVRAAPDRRDGEVTRASIHIDYRGIRQTFKTENRTQAPELIQIRLVSGPFDTLDGTWRFRAILAPNS